MTAPTATTTRPWLDATLPIEDRVDLLLAQSSVASPGANAWRRWLGAA